jgi:rare lipoprotein A
MKHILLVCFLLAQGCIVVHAQSAAKTIRESNRKKEIPDKQIGVASYYHSKFTGRLTASGEKYDPEKMTCAHNGLPMGARIKVTNLRNKRWVIVRVNDRLHHKNTRIVDLSRAAAAKLGYVKRGLTRVKVEVLKH